MILDRLSKLISTIETHELKMLCTMRVPFTRIIVKVYPLGWYRPNRQTMQGITYWYIGPLTIYQKGEQINDTRSRRR